MKIILKKEVIGLGEAGDIVNVKTGYALNYLVPQGFATVGTASAIKQHEETLRQRAHKEAKLIADAQAVAAKAAAVEIKISAKVGENGKLYGGITAGQVAEILAGAGVEVEKRNITLPEIKAVGEYEATVHFHKEVEVKVPVNVVPENALVAAPAAEEAPVEAAPAAEEEAPAAE